MTPVAQIAEEINACRRAARDCTLVLLAAHARTDGRTLPPHEAEEAAVARRRIAASLGLRL